MFNVIVFLITYLLCSVNPAILLSKKIIGTDIRKVGSGNAGTTNAIRTMGKGWGAIVFLLDIAKVAVSYWIMLLLAKLFGITVGASVDSFYLVGAIIGHCYPIYYGFKGGKGVVAMLIASMLLQPKITIVCLIVALIIIVIARMVSLGSLSAVVLYDIMVLVLEPSYFIGSAIASFVIIYKHRSNIKRIINKDENKLF